jgi:very-short-patch-repair endonuclease
MEADRGSKKASWQTADGAVYGKLKEFAEHNRKNPTEAEAILWQFLKGRQLNATFRRQHVIGPFIADFSCPTHHLIIEIDGGYHQLPEQQTSDQHRTAWLEQQGYTVLRFANEEVVGNTERVVEEIKRKLRPTPDP